MVGSYPNPFNSQTLIRYRVESPSQVKIDVFNLLGRKILTVVDTYQESGSYQAIWDAASYKSGIYYCRIQVGQETQTLKTTLVK